jgi:hypothetical protein
VSDSGTLGDSTTTDTTPTVQGTGATPGDTITLYAPNGVTVLGTAVVAAGGTWSITPTTALADGVQNLQVTATDPQGNVSAPTTLPITIDTTAPAAPVAALASTSDSGTQGDSKTNDTTPTLSGTGEPGAAITVKDASGAVIATATVAADGTWSATPANALPQGVNNLAVTATDAAGNTSAPTTVPVTIDTAVTTPAIAPTNGIGAVSGTGEPSATVTLMSGSTLLGTAVVGSDGTWSVPLSAALANTTALSATAVDAAGNTSAPGTSVVDTTMPDINPTNGAVLTGTGKPGNTIALTLADGTGENAGLAIAAVMAALFDQGIGVLHGEQKSGMACFPRHSAEGPFNPMDRQVEKSEDGVPLGRKKRETETSATEQHCESASSRAIRTLFPPASRKMKKAMCGNFGDFWGFPSFEKSCQRTSKKSGP